MSGNSEILITGGAGFIGTNLAHWLLSAGQSVVVLDDFSRNGSAANLEWLRGQHGRRLRVEIGDVRDPRLLEAALEGVSQVFHFAAQVAVTTSIADPTYDFEVNARGTLGLLEAMRALPDPPSLVFTSTNKVYGALEDLRLQADETRYRPAEATTNQFGISEQRPLDFHSPYGCSKGAADQYVLDYARTYGLRAVVFRMSCIYGPHQCGNEDQGWVAHFLNCALARQPITIYGDGMQVRDVLFIDDLVEAFVLAQARMPDLSGHAFNIGGGPENTVSLLELFDLIRELHGGVPLVRHARWRTGDQLYYVSDTRRFRSATEWAPRTGVREGFRKLYEWLREARERQAAAVPPQRVLTDKLAS